MLKVRTQKRRTGVSKVPGHPFVLIVEFDWNKPWRLARYYKTAEEREEAAARYESGFLFVKGVEEIDHVGAKASQRSKETAARGADQAPRRSQGFEAQASV